MILHVECDITPGPAAGRTFDHIAPDALTAAEWAVPVCHDEFSHNVFLFYFIEVCTLQCLSPIVTYFGLSCYSQEQETYNLRRRFPRADGLFLSGPVSAGTDTVVTLEAVLKVVGVGKPAAQGDIDDQILCFHQLKRGLVQPQVAEVLMVLNPAASAISSAVMGSRKCSRMNPAARTMAWSVV